MVSLSRFELFRPERRPFFTQDANRFGFGGLDDDEPALVPFFSRRIALGRTLDAGLKVSGSAGPVELGAFAVQGPGLHGDAPRTRLGVLRAAAGIGATQRIGMIATHGDPGGQARNRLAGVDWQYLDTDFLDGRTLRAYASSQRSHDSVQGEGAAHALSIDYPNVGLIGAAYLFHIDDAYRPALGYVQETGIRRGFGNIGWWHRSAAGDSLIARVLASGWRHPSKCCPASCSAPAPARPSATGPSASACLPRGR